MKEILLVAPLPDIVHKAQEIVLEQGYDDVEVVLGNLGEGVAAARGAIAQGTVILVSRGGTYRMIKAALDVPVVEIRVTAYDIIESIRELGACDEPIGVVGYNNVVDGFDILKTILPMPVEKIVIEREEEISALVEEHKRQGIHTYVGDGTLTTGIEKQGCRTVLITSQKDSIATAIREARRMLRATRAEKRRLQQITTIIDFVHDGLVAIDETGAVALFNQAAEQIFGMKKAQVVGRSIREALCACKLPDLLQSQLPQFGQIMTVGNEQVVINRIPVVVEGRVEGAVATFQRVDDMQSMEQKVRRKLADRGLSARYTFADILYESPQMEKCIATAKEYAKYDTPTLLTGESGVGKELFCQSMHNAGPRRHGPFRAVNCAAIPPSLIESELFGYAEGSFTGASRRGKAGIFEQAHRGTVFLDEISEIPLELQGKLLRVVQEKEVTRLGDDKNIPVDLKILCASNRDLMEMVRAGKFRKDLYYRVSILTLRIPALRDRRADILPLAEFFLKKYSSRYQKKAPPLTDAVRRFLLSRRYEGNVRELEGLMERCVILDSFDSLSEAEAQEEPEDQDLESLACAHMRRVFAQTGGDVARTCELLGVSRSTLWRKRREYGF